MSLPRFAPLPIGAEPVGDYRGGKERDPAGETNGGWRWRRDGSRTCRLMPLMRRGFYGGADRKVVVNNKNA